MGAVAKKSRQLAGTDADYVKRLSKKDLEWLRASPIQRSERRRKKSRQLSGTDADYAKRLSKKDLEWLRVFEQEYYEHKNRGLMSPIQRSERRRAQRAAQADALYSSDSEGYSEGYSEGSSDDALYSSDSEGLGAASDARQESPEDDILEGIDRKRGR